MIVDVLWEFARVMPAQLPAKFPPRLEDACYFLRKDLKSGYHQVQLKEGDKLKMACEIEFLIHLIGKGSVRMDPSKVKAIRNWIASKGVPQLTAFRGLANYNWKFIKGFFRLAAPLTNLLKKDVKWMWTDRCQRALDELKSTISSEPDGHLVAYES
ncbi:putative mitochondrial protein AtMg00860 [Wolffia australiana]